MHADDPDDIDRLFARLERVEAPATLAAEVQSRISARRRVTVAWPWLIAGVIAMALLGVAGYLAGETLAATDGLDIIEALLGDYGLLTTAPGDVLAALGEVIPWPLVALAGLSAACMIWAAGRIVSRAPAPSHSRA